MRKLFSFMPMFFLLFILPMVCVSAEEGGRNIATRSVIIAELKGPVQVKIRELKDWRDAHPGDVLHEMDEIRTAAGGFALLLLDKDGETGKMELKEKSHLKLSTMKIDSTSLDKTTYLDLAIGKVLVHAQKLKADSKFEVRTPTGTAGVRGTVFEVSVEE